MSSAEKLFRKKNRLSRMMHLLRRIRSAPLSVSYRQNHVTFLHDGEHFFQSLYAAIRLAKRFILVEFYIIHNDQTGAFLADVLAEAVGRGVRVLLIYDYIGCIDTPEYYFRDMAYRGIELTPFNVPSFKRGPHWFDRRDHRKMVIIDGSLAFLGGFNVGDEYSGLARGPCRFHDVGLSISGSAVRELVNIFSGAWQMERGEFPQLSFPGDDEGESPTGREDGSVTIVSGGPLSRRSHIRSAFLFNIAAATEKILIATPYFIPDPGTIRSLLQAARRGVLVRLLLPARSDIPVMRLLGRSFYIVLLRGEIEIFEMEYEILHAKVMLIDGKQTIIGSANLDQRSFHRNFEINLIINDEAFGTEVQTKLLEDFRKSRQISLADHERRGILTRWLEKAINLFGWFL